MGTMPQLVGGVDTHADVHCAAVVDGNGIVLATASFSTNSEGYRRLVRWLAGYGRVGMVGVEGTSSYGKGLTSFLRDINVEVVE